MIINPYRFSGGGGGFTDPTDISGLQFWMTPNDTGTISATGGLVDQIDDQSGNSNHATSTLTARPDTGVRTIGGLNALGFDGSDDVLALTTSIAPTTGYTIFAVTRGDVTGGNRTIVGGAAGAFQLRIDSSDQLDVVRAGEAVVLSGTVAITEGVDKILACTTSSAGSATYDDGGTAMDSNATDPAYTTSLVGISASGQLYNGSLGDVVIYNRVLNSAEMNQVGGFLDTKYGITWTDI